MKRFILFALLLALGSVQTMAQKSSILILGDLHYDLLADHDMNWLKTKPDDFQ